jgi:hypothetical protein
MKPREQEPALTQDAEALAPDRPNLRTEDVRYGVKHQVERGIVERAQVAHVAEHRAQLEAFAIGDEPVLLELLRRVVEHGDVRARRGEHGPLLAAAGSKAQHVGALHVGWEPVAGHRLISDEHHAPVTCTSARDRVGAGRTRPLVVLLDELVPGVAVVSDGVDWRVHRAIVLAAPCCENSSKPPS